ncbi:unnamed protein product [Trichogramma brassicae]|uniref:Integrase catalytic domain-containing protein n=1 Tax=Trichogramma brassicae TaxID=86971 RepID=A0A6H5ISN9_9HYME|nr:unnamed protein product [Trichogramma brassicae]
MPEQKVEFENIHVIADEHITDDEQELSLFEIDTKVQATEADDKFKTQLKNLCIKHRSCFRKTPGRFKSYEHTIIMKNDEPFFMKSYPIPDKYRDKVSEEIDNMLRYGVIERAVTPYINPLVIVPKKNGAVRICCLDARQINDRMQEDHDGPEEIDQVLRRCQGIGVMSSLDLRASFWQVPLAHESRKYTGFSHQGYTYQYTSVPFGLKISSAALNRAAETILRDMRDSVIAFVDDWLVVSATMEQHLQDLDELLTRISDENVTYGHVKVIQSDHGSQFTSKAWTFSMNREKIKIIFSSIRHAQSNLVERYNKEIGRFLRTLAGDDHPSWANWCQAIAEIMNTTVNETTGFCPLELQTGQKPERFWTKYVPTEPETKPYEQVCDEARANIQKKGQARAEKWNSEHKITSLDIGNLVLVKALRVPSGAAQRAAKLLSLYEGPYENCP